LEGREIRPGRIPYVPSITEKYADTGAHFSATYPASPVTSPLTLGIGKAMKNGGVGSLEVSSEHNKILLLVSVQKTSSWDGHKEEFNKEESKGWEIGQCS